MSHQDWQTITFVGGGKPTTKKPQPQRDERALRAAQLDAETEELKHATIGRDLKLALMQARAAKGLSQKDVASAMHLPVNVVNGYESGSLVPDNALIARFERTLGARLPRVPRRRPSHL